MEIFDTVFIRFLFVMLDSSQKQNVFNFVDVVFNVILGNVILLHATKWKANIMIKEWS